MSGRQTGIYFLADDGVFDWAAAMLSSLRIEAPSITVSCIPFSDRTSRLEQLKSKFRFTMVDDPTLSELDDIGRDVYHHMNPTPPMHLVGAFRKFFMFWGPLERFLYIDSDVVVLKGFKQLFNHATNSDQQLTYAHADMGQVYKPGLLRERMAVDHHSRGINTGLWASQRGTFSLQQIQELAASSRMIADQFCPTLEQPFMNYCLDVSSIVMSQLDEAYECAWAGDPRPMSAFPSGDAMRATWPDGRLIPAIHWAGYNLESTMPHHHIFNHFRLVGKRPPCLREVLMRRIKAEGLASISAAILRKLYKPI